MEDVQVALKIDTKGLSCPLPIIRAKKGIESIAIGEVMEVLATDPGSVSDFKAWSRATGHELLQAEQIDSVYVYRIRRSK